MNVINSTFWTHSPKHDSSEHQWTAVQQSFIGKNVSYKWNNVANQMSTAWLLHRQRLAFAFNEERMENNEHDWGNKMPEKKNNSSRGGGGRMVKVLLQLYKAIAHSWSKKATTKGRRDICDCHCNHLPGPMQSQPRGRESTEEHVQKTSQFGNPAENVRW